MPDHPNWRPNLDGLIIDLGLFICCVGGVAAIMGLARYVLGY